MSRSITVRLLGSTLVILALFVLMAADSEDTSSAASVSQIRVVEKVAEPFIFTNHRGEPDFGSRVRVLLKNRGVSVTATVSVILSCSEGRWKKEASTKLERDESGNVYVDFPEPTIAASDIMIAKVEVVRVQ